MWGTWFGGQGTGQKRKDAPKKAILDLRQQLDMLQKRERHLMNQMDKQDEIARENVSTNKTGEQTLHPTSPEACLERPSSVPSTSGDIALWHIHLFYARKEANGTFSAYSCTKRFKAKEATRALSRADQRADLHA